MADVQPADIERGGIRTERRPRYPDDPRSGDVIHLKVTATSAAVSMTVDQAHEALDQLAWQLGRHDLAALHHNRQQPYRK